MDWSYDIRMQNDRRNLEQIFFLWVQPFRLIPVEFVKVGREVDWEST